MSGGYVGIVGGRLAPVTLHPDECLTRPDTLAPLRCLRRGHPTATSDCSEGWRAPAFIAPPPLPDDDQEDEEAWN